MKPHFVCLLVLGSAALSACAPARQTAEIESARGGSLASGIIGGQDVPADHGLTHSVVALYNGATREFCSGVLIGSRQILTAAHCADPRSARSLVVYFGPQAGPRAPYRFAEKISPSRVWAGSAERAPQQDAGDLAIVHLLADPPPGTRPIQVLPLERVGAIRPGLLTMIAGFGANDGRLRRGQGRLRMVSVRVSRTDFSRSEVLIDQRTRQGACHGDSGAPAFVFVGGTPYVWGIVRGGTNDPQGTCENDAVVTLAPIVLPSISP